MNLVFIEVALAVAVLAVVFYIRNQSRGKTLRAEREARGEPAPRVWPIRVAGVLFGAAMIALGILGFR